MKYRKLRIAWSVAWGVLAVLLVVLWSRSYWRSDGVDRWGKNLWCYVYSREGTLQLQHTYEVNEPGWRFFSEPLLDNPMRTDQPLPSFDWNGDLWSLDFNFMMPHWLAVILVASLAVVPWLRFRFSIRTLLIATALIAVALGMIVWMSRGG